MAELTAMASQLGLRLRTTTSSFGPSHAPMWLCKYTLEGEDVSIHGQSPSHAIKSMAEYPVRQQIEKILRDRSGSQSTDTVDDIVSGFRSSGCLAVPQSEPQVPTSSERFSQPTIVEPPVCRPRFEDAFRNLAEIVDDSESRRSAVRLSHVKLMLKQLGPHFDGVALPVKLTDEHYVKMCNILIPRFSDVDSTLADAHNKLMHSINGNETCATRAYTAYKTLERQNARDKWGRSRPIPTFPEFLEIYRVVLRETCRQRLAAFREKVKYRRAIPLTELTLRIWDLQKSAPDDPDAWSEALAMQHNKVMHCTNGNIRCLPLLMFMYCHLVLQAAAFKSVYNMYTSGGSGETWYQSPLACTDSTLGLQLPNGPYEATLYSDHGDGGVMVLYQADHCAQEPQTAYVNLGNSWYVDVNSTGDIHIDAIVDMPALSQYPANFKDVLFHKTQRCVCLTIRSQVGGKTFATWVLTAPSQASGFDAVKAAKNNKLMHALNGNHFHHNVRLISRHGKMPRGKRFLGRKWQALMKRHGVYGPAIGCFVQMTDPFHDEGYDVVALPSNNTNRSLTCPNEVSVAISKPAEIADDLKWDLNIIASNLMCPYPYVQLRDGQSLDAVPNGVYCTGAEFDFDPDNSNYNNVLKYTAGVIDGAAVFPVGLVALATASGSDTLPFGNNTAVYGSQIPIPLDLVRGEHRCVGFGFESTNVSNALDKPGMVHCYRSPYQVVPESVLGGASSPKQVDYAFRQAMISQRLPGTLVAIKSIQDTKGWEAKRGAYCVVRPVGMPEVHRPSLALPITRSTAVENFEPLFNDGSLYISTGACGIEIGGTPGAKTLKVIPVEFTYHHWDVSGMFYTGLDAATVIQVDAVQLLEHIPNAANPTDRFNCKIAKIPPKISPQFEKVFQRTMSVLPPGVPVMENDFGDWWESVCDVVAAVSPLADGVAPGAGNVVRTVAATAKQVPKVVKTVKTVVSERRARTANKPKSIASKKKMVKPR